MYQDEPGSCYYQNQHLRSRLRLLLFDSFETLSEHGLVVLTLGWIVSQLWLDGNWDPRVLAGRTFGFYKKKRRKMRRFSILLPLCSQDWTLLISKRKAELVRKSHPIRSNWRLFSSFLLTLTRRFYYELWRQLVHQSSQFLFVRFICWPSELDRGS